MTIKYIIQAVIDSDSFSAVDDWLRLNTGESIHDRIPELLDVLTNPDDFDEFVDIDSSVGLPLLPGNATIEQSREHTGDGGCDLLLAYYIDYWWNSESFSTACNEEFDLQGDEAITADQVKHLYRIDCPCDDMDEHKDCSCFTDKYQDNAVAITAVVFE
jgi:hypothetical protein